MIDLIKNPTPRLRVIQKLYSKTINPDEKIIYNKSQYKKFIKDVTEGTIERRELIEETIQKFLKNDIDLIDQINNKIEESLNLLFMNNLISQKNNFYSLSEKTKIHIQSMDPIKINGFSGNIEYIMDFLP